MKITVDIKSYIVYNSLNKFKEVVKMTKRCAVCGDTTKLNVRLAWRRDRDGRTVNICCLCAESGKVNENSIDNFTTEDTLYKEEKSDTPKTQNTMRAYYNGKSAFGGKMRG